MASEITYPHFVNDTTQSGINSVYKGEWQFMVGGGVASFDCNDDGLPELYVAGGENPSQLLINQSVKSALKFTNLKSPTEQTEVTGAYPIDINSDSITDLVVLRVGQSKVFQGLGKCQFEDASQKWNFDGGDAWTTAFSATWEAGNNWPSLAIGTYIDREFEDEPWGHCTDNWLLRPEVEMHSFAKRIPLTPSYCALSMLFTDWNRSGTQSLRVANDREYYLGGQEQLWKIPPLFTPELYTLKEGWKFQRFWGMGIAGAELNGDEYPEYMLTSMADQRLQFLKNGTKYPTYQDAPFSMNTSAHRPFAGGDQRPSTGWHTQFEDVNNDGRYDLFIAKGNVDSMPDFAIKDPSNLLLQQMDGNFIEGAEHSGLLNYGKARGASVVDLNHDGKLDVVIINRNENLSIWRNDSENLGHWVGIKPQMNGANRDAIGAWIEVKTDVNVMRREVTIGGGHVSGILAPWHFGMGNSTKAQVRILWPHGKWSAWQDVEVDTINLLEN